MSQTRTTPEGRTFGLGHIANPNHRFTNVRLALARKGLAAVPVQGLDYRVGSFLPAVFDQGSSGSCEGHAAAAGIYAALQKSGSPLGFIPSMDDLYRIGRALDRADPMQPLTDAGTEGNSIIRAMQEFGVRRMSKSLTSDGRFSDVEAAPELLNAEPTLANMEQDAEHVELGAYSILESSANDVADAYAQSLAAFGPIPTASFVNTAFMNWNPDNGPVDTVNAQDPNGGGHKILCVGWRWMSGDQIVTATSEGAERQWIIRNSWGEDWGDAGYFYATDGWLAQTDEREVYALAPGPTMRSWADSARSADVKVLTKKAT